MLQRRQVQIKHHFSKGIGTEMKYNHKKEIFYTMKMTTIKQSNKQTTQQTIKQEIICQQVWNESMEQEWILEERNRLKEEEEDQNHSQLEHVQEWKN